MNVNGYYKIKTKSQKIFREFFHKPDILPPLNENGSARLIYKFFSTLD